MPEYRVKVGHVLPHNGTILPAGSIVDLPAHVAADSEVAYRLEPLEPGAPVVEALPAADLAPYRVRAGHVLPHAGAVAQAGSVVYLTPGVAGDTEIAYRVEPVVAEESEDVPPMPTDDPSADEE